MAKRRTMYGEGSWEYEIKRLLENVNEFLEGDKTLTKSSTTTSASWYVISDE